MAEEIFHILKRTLSPFMEVILSENIEQYADAVCGNLILDIEKTILAQPSVSDKYLRQPYIDLIALHNSNKINESEVYDIKDAFKKVCDNTNIDFDSWYHNNNNRENIEKNILRSGDLYMANCFLGRLNPNLIFIVPDNSKLVLEDGYVYVDDHLENLLDAFKRIIEPSYNYPELSVDKAKKVLTLDNYLKDINPGVLTESELFDLRFSKMDSMTGLEIKKIGEVKDIPISSLNNYHPEISLSGYTYAKGYAVPPRIMFTKS